MKVLHVIPSLEYSGAAMQLALLGRGMPHDKIATRVCVLGKEGPCTQPLRAAGVPVAALGWTRCFDPAPPWQLRRLVRRIAPDVIHTWGPPALRAITLVAGNTGGSLVVIKPLSAGRRPNRLDRWLLCRADLGAAVPSRAEGGVTFALEAMAAGRLVIASRLPALAEVVTDGATDFLVTPGDKVAMARQTHLLLGDAARRQAMGAAGTGYVRDAFGTGDLVRRVTGLYDALAA